MAVTAAMESFRIAAKDYYNNERFSDISIVCEGRKFKVHRCFISIHSKVFERICSGAFLEASKKVIDLKEDLPEAVEKMIEFFYTFDYDEITTDPLPDIEEKKPTSKLQLNAWMYALAEKYDVPGLKKLAVAKFTHNAQYDNADAMLGVAWTVYREISLPETDRTLHDAVLNMWILGGKDLMADTGKARLEAFMVDIPGFLPALLERIVSGFTGTVRRSCKNCTLGDYAEKSKAQVAGSNFPCDCSVEKRKHHVTVTTALALEMDL